VTVVQQALVDVCTTNNVQLFDPPPPPLLLLLLLLTAIYHAEP